MNILNQTSNAIEPMVYIEFIEYGKIKSHGIWINCNQPMITIQKEIDGYISSFPNKNPDKWVITNTRNLGDIDLSELNQVKTIYMACKLYVRYGDVFTEYLKMPACVSTDIKIWDFEKNYKGIWNSLEQYIAREIDTKHNFCICDIEISNHVDYQTITNELLVNKKYYVNLTSQMRQNHNNLESSC